MRLLLLGLLFISAPAFALVDMRNANYSDSWTDIEAPGAGFPLKITRAYNSRSLFNGIFGFGWCSDIETDLEVTAEGSIKITECGDGAEIIYRARDFSKDEVNDTVEKILTAVKKETPTQPSAAASKLKADLTADRAMREDYAVKYKIQGKVAEGRKYFANGRENEVVVREKNGYVRTIPDGSQQKFDLAGKLAFLYDKTGNFLKYAYQTNQLTEISDNLGRKLAFQYYPNKKVKAILGPNRLTATYQYKGINDLESVKTAAGNLYTYKYDDLHNLTDITYPDKTSKKNHL
jgi:YD repeat-containing protein